MMFPEEDRTKRLSHQFKNFAEFECHGSSPLYESLSLGISEDQQLLKLAAESTHLPVPNLLLAAVHYLLLKDPRHGLSRFYPDIAGLGVVSEGALTYFRSFCDERSDELSSILKTRLVQTNEVGRSALLLPAFELVSAISGRPLNFIDIGAAAGLNLLWSRYFFDYGSVTYGRRESQVQIRCELRGKMKPPLSGRFPEVASAVGIDLHPLDVRRQDDALWLEALVWPEHTQRRQLLRAAIEEAKRQSPSLIEGDALEVLPRVLSSLGDAPACVYASFTLNQFSPDSREELQRLLEAKSVERELFFITAGRIERGEHAEISMISYSGGVRDERLLGHCDPHGGWLEWDLAQVRI